MNPFTRTRKIVTEVSMRSKTLVITLFTFSTPIAVRAQLPDTTTLAPVVVSATKGPSESGNLTQAVTVIAGSELRARGVSRVSDALRVVPGVTIAQNGSTGSVNTLFLRGGESRYTKVIIDGVTVNSPGGFFDFSHLTTDNVERIEIVRGPASVVYGADAVTGIIQIFTRQGGGPLSVTAEGKAGSYQTREGIVEATGSAGRARYSVGGAGRRTDGVLPFNNQYYNGTLSGSAGFSPASGTDVSVSSRYTAAEFHYPTDYTGAPVDSNSYRVQHRLTAGMDVTSDLGGSITARATLGTNHVSDLTEDIAVPFGAQAPIHSAMMSRNRRTAAEAGLTAAFSRVARLSLGAEHVSERERSVNSEGPVGGEDLPTSSFTARRHTNAAYAELLGDVTDLVSYTLAARVDDNSDYDAHATYRAGMKVRAGAATSIRASLSTAFNAPAFNQLRPTLYTSGSPGLRPERGRSWEIAAEQRFAEMVNVSAGYFDQRFSDMIQFVAGGPPEFLGSYANLTEAESNGFEVEMSMLPWRGLSASASYTNARPRVSRVSSAYTGDLRPGDALIRRPRHSGHAALTWTPGTSSVVAATLSYAGERPDLDFSQFPSPVVHLPAYARVDLSGSQDLFRFASGRSALGITLRIENLLDRRYEDVLNYPAPGRTVILGARFRGSL